MDANEQRNARARRLRNYAIAAVLGALVVLFYVMTIVRVHP
jgi:cell division septal protein FtsQ